MDALWGSCGIKAAKFSLFKSLVGMCVMSRFDLIESKDGNVGGPPLMRYGGDGGKSLRQDSCPLRGSRSKFPPLPSRHGRGKDKVIMSVLIRYSNIRTHVIKLVSTAGTGYFYTLVRPRTARPKKMMKFDPRSTFLRMIPPNL